MTNINKISKYGKALIEANPSHKIEVYNTGTNLTNEDEILFLVKEVVQENGIDISQFYTKHVVKENSKGVGMNPHLDDYQLVKRKEILYNNDQYINLGNDWYLFRNNKEKPFLSCIYYMSTEGIDFIGGELVFSDISSTSIKPEIGKLVVFQSAYFVHHVNPIKSGTRKCMLIKFYPNV